MFGPVSVRCVYVYTRLCACACMSAKCSRVCVYMCGEPGFKMAKIYPSFSMFTIFSLRFHYQVGVLGVWTR